MGPFLGRFFSALGASFLWGRFWGHFGRHFGVDFGSNFRPFWGDEDDDDDDDDDDVHVRRHENLNLTTYVSLFQTRSPELRAAALAEGLYNFHIFFATKTNKQAMNKSKIENQQKSIDRPRSCIVLFAI